jgi:hypothetical protein
MSFSDLCGCLLINLFIYFLLFIYLFIYLFILLPLAEAARSKAWVFSRLLAGIAASNPAGAWVSVSCECCVVR